MTRARLLSGSKSLLCTDSFSMVGEGSEVPYSGDISLVAIGGSSDAGGGDEGVSKLVADFE